jgi:predicted HNH restriction endonuclease
MACGYDEDERILEVHHIDEDRNNNDIKNLCILCPNCHVKITYHFYELLDDFSLKKL